MQTELLLDLALILFATKIFGLLTKRLHLPQVVGALLSGIILGPALLGIVSPNEYIDMLAEFGVIILMFTAGLETDFKKLRELIRPSLIIAALGVIVSVGGGFAFALWFGLGVFESIFIGVIYRSAERNGQAENKSRRDYSRRVGYRRCVKSDRAFCFYCGRRRRIIRRKYRHDPAYDNIILCFCRDMRFCGVYNI
jgi:hypothetical protein